MGRMAVSFGDYYEECVKAITDKYGRRVGSFVLQQFNFPPRYIYTRNNAPIDPSYAAYFGIDTIYTGNTFVLSWDKGGYPLWNVK